MPIGNTATSSRFDSTRTIAAGTPFDTAEEQFSAGQSFRAAFADMNLIANAIDFGTRDSRPGQFRDDPDFDLESALSGANYTDAEREFVSQANSQAEFFFLSGKIGKARRRKQAAGQNFIASAAGSIIGAVADPITFVPFIGTGAKAAQLSRGLATTAGRLAARLGGAGLGEIAEKGLLRVGTGIASTVRGAPGARLSTRAVAGAAIGAGEEVIRESALQHLQLERSMEESVANVVGGALFGGAVFPVAGALFGGATRQVRRMATDIVQDSMRRQAAKMDQIPGITNVQDQIINTDSFAFNVARVDFNDPAAQAAARKVLFGTQVTESIAESSSKGVLPDSVDVNDPVSLFGALSMRHAREGGNVSSASTNKVSSSALRQSLMKSGLSARKAASAVKSVVAVARGTASESELKQAAEAIVRALGYDAKTIKKISGLSNAQVRSMFKAKTPREIGDAINKPLPGGARSKILDAKEALVGQPGVKNIEVAPPDVQDVVDSIRVLHRDDSEVSLSDLVGAAAASMGGDVKSNIEKIAPMLSDIGKVSQKEAEIRADTWSKSVDWYANTRDGEIALHRSRVALEAPRMAKDLRTLDKDLKILREVEGDEAPATGDTLSVLGDRVQDISERLKQIDELTAKADEASDAAEREALNVKMREEEAMVRIALKEINSEVADRKAAASAGLLGIIRMSRVSPRTMMLTSLSPVMRKLTIQGTSLASITEADLRGTGIAYSAETERAAWQSFAGDTISRYESLRKKSKMTSSDFNSRVYRVLSGMSRGVSDESKEVMDAAMGVRSMLGQMGVAAHKAGLFENDLLEDYIKRAYNRREVINDIDGFRAVLVKHIEMGNKLEEGRSASDAVDKIIDGIIGSGSASSESATRGRTVNFGIDFSHPDFEKYIDKDISRILKSYTRTTGGKIAFSHAFGGLSPAELRAVVVEDYTRLLKEAQGNPRLLKKISKDKDMMLGKSGKSKGYFDAMVDELNGSFSHSAFDALPESVITASAVATNSIIAAKSWGFALAQVVDAANIARIAGGRSFIKQVPLFGKALVDVIRGADVDTLRELAILSDSSRLGSEMLAFGRMNISDPSTNIVVEGTRVLAHKSMKLSGMLAANDTIKRVASVTVLDRINRIAHDVSVGKAISKGDQLMIARAGLDKSALKSFVDNADTNVKYGAAEIPAIHKWADSRAAAQIEFGIKRLMSDVMPEAGVLDKPLWMSNPAFKIFGILRGYTLSSATRLTTQAAQQIVANPADMRAYSAMMIASAMGVLEFGIRQGIKDSASGRDPGERWKKMSSEQVAAVAIDRSGYLALASEFNGLFEGATGRGIPGLGAIFDTSQSAFAADPSDPSTFPAPSFAEAMMGPGGSIANSAVRATGKLVAPGENDDRMEQAKRLADSLPILGFMHLGRIALTAAGELTDEDDEE